MSSHPVFLSDTPTTEAGPAVRATLWQRWDGCLAVPAASGFAAWANRVVWFGLALFALSLPHSIAAAHIGLDLSLLAWLCRDGAMRHWHFSRTPYDWPLLCFAALTLLSAVFSTEPALSLPKLKSLLLFGVLYVMATNLSARAVKPLLALLLLSGLVGVLYSFADKLYGRGVIIKTIAVDSPLWRAASLDARLQPGDALWMIAHHRVYSLAGMRNAVRQHPVDARLEIEALHQGDPIPATVTVTAEMKASANPLGVSVAGRTHRFRVSGFGRQFQTYAEQMQLLALLCYGLLLVGLGKLKRATALSWLAGLFLCFSVGLLLTFTRAVLAAFLVTVLLLPAFLRGKRAAFIGVVLAVVMGFTAISWLSTTRSTEVMNDSTARRLEYMQAGLRVIPHHPILGVGMDAAKAHWQAWGFPGAYVTHTHSTPIQIAMERGIPALLVLVWLWWTACLTAWRSLQQASRSAPASAFNVGLALSVLGALCGFALSSLVNYNFGDAEALWLLLSLVGLLQVSRRTEVMTA